MVMYGYTMSITIHNHFCCTICFEEKRMKNPKDRIREIEKRLEQLPKGTLTFPYRGTISADLKFDENVCNAANQTEDAFW